MYDLPNRENKCKDTLASSVTVPTSRAYLKKKLLRFYELLKADTQVKVTEALLDN